MENMNKYSNNTKLAWYTIVGMITLLILITLLGGCATIQKTSKECFKSEKTLQ